MLISLTLKKLGQKKFLLRIAEEAGISRERAKAMLDSDEFAADVKATLQKQDKLAYKAFRFSLLTVNMQFPVHNQQKHLRMHCEKLRKKKEFNLMLK